MAGDSFWGEKRNKEVGKRKPEKKITEAEIIEGMNEKRCEIKSYFCHRQKNDG